MFSAFTDEEIYPQGLFDSVQSAIETSVIPWLASCGSEDQNVPKELYRRETITLVRSDNPKYNENKQIRDIIQRSKATEAKISTDWTSIICRWQRIQRISIGASLNLVAIRTDSYDEVISWLNKIDDTENFNGYVEGLLQDLSHDSLKLWLPGAVNIINQLNAKIDSSDRRRHVPAIFLDHFLTGEGAQREMPEVTFASAASLSMERGDVSMAVRYADLALRSDEKARQQKRAHEAFHPELIFLCAATYRYSIGQQVRHFGKIDGRAHAPQKAVRSFESVKEVYTKARRLIMIALAYHEAGRANATTEEAILHNQVRRLRAISERAALYLFYATSIGLSRISRSPTFRQYELAREVTDAVRLATKDIKDCFEIFSDLVGSEAAMDKSSVEILGLIEMQFTINAIASTVLRYILEEHVVYSYLVDPLKLFKRASRLLSKFQINHAVARSELAAFEVIMFKQALTASHSKPESENDSCFTPLDRILLKVISEKVLSRKYSPRSSA